MEKNKNKLIGIGFIGLAVLLLILGCNAYQSTASTVSRALIGVPTDKALWLMIGSAIAAITAVFSFSTDHSDCNRSQ